MYLFQISNLKNMQEQDIPQLNPNDSEADDKTVFIQKNQMIQEDNDATVILNKPYMPTQEADDATVINIPQKNQNVQEDNDATVILNKPYMPTQNAEETTIILGKQPLFQYNADEATQILPQQTRPVFQTPQNNLGDNDTTIISKPTQKSFTPAEKPIQQPSENVFSQHKNKILIGVAGLCGLLVGIYMVMKPTAQQPIQTAKQTVEQPISLPTPRAMEVAPINTDATPPEAPKEKTNPAVIQAPVVPNIKKNLPKTNPSKAAPATTFIPPTPTTQPKAETPKPIEDNPDQPLKPVEITKPTAAQPKTYKINELSQIPEFSDIQGYFKRNMNYPNEAKRLKIKGSVFILATIEPNGRVSGASVLKGLGYGCDEAALEAVRKMSNWTPGRANGQMVRSEISVRVPFQ